MKSSFSLTITVCYDLFSARRRRISFAYISVKGISSVRLRRLLSLGEVILNFDSILVDFPSVPLLKWGLRCFKAAVTLQNISDHEYM